MSRCQIIVIGRRLNTDAHPRVSVCLVFSLMCFGCSGSRHGGFSWLGCCGWVAAAVFLVVILPVIVNAIGHSRAEARQARLQRLREAPARYAHTIRELGPALESCSHIQHKEAARSELFQEGSWGWNARERSLKLVGQAHDDALLLCEHELTEQRYDAVTELARIKSCCENCPQAQRSKFKAVCHALDDRQQVHVDLLFQRQSEGGRS